MIWMSYSIVASKLFDRLNEARVSEEIKSHVAAMVLVTIFL